MFTLPRRLSLAVVLCALSVSATADQRGWTFQVTPLTTWFPSPALQNGAWPIVSGYFESAPAISKLTPTGWQVIPTRGTRVHQRIAGGFGGRDDPDAKE